MRFAGPQPGSIQRGEGFAAQQVRAEVPAGLPSSILERRPDIQIAEQHLIAANADIGQAKAAFYPQLTLTGFYGYQTVALSDLFNAPVEDVAIRAGYHDAAVHGRPLKANLKVTQAQYQEALATYQRTVQSAFREVSDGLIAYQRTSEFTARQESAPKPTGRPPTSPIFATTAG